MRYNPILIAICGWGLATAAATADAPPVFMDAERLTTDGFVALFDGETLDGWSRKGGEGQYRVEDGCIVGTGENVKANTFLCTEKTFGDFVLIFEMKFDDLSGNSGLMFRAGEREDGRVFGYQCEHDNKDRSWSAGLYDEARRGWLAPAADDEVKKTEFTEQGRGLFRLDDWNTMVIECVGLRTRIWLNGELRVDFTDEAGQDFDRPGFIGLQVHAGESCRVRWRNLYLQDRTGAATGTAMP